MTTELTVVVPTFNERENIVPLVEATERALTEVDWEIIIVDDDSNDGTSEVVRSIAQRNRRVRGIQRIRRSGLTSACIEGMMACSSPYIAVMDADMQHDEKLLPHMLMELKQSDRDVVIGSRYMEGGSTGEFRGARLWISKVATFLSHVLLGTQLSDPMSGFFMLKRTFLETTVRQIYGKGFKVLLDLFASAKQPVSYAELPYTMRTRKRGQSKLGFSVVLEFIMMLAYKLTGRIISGRFIKFSSVGLIGVGVHISTLFLIYLVLGTGFTLGQSLATLTAMTSNYILNNLFTFRDQRLAGSAFFNGLLKFYIACSIGAVISVALASFLHDHGTIWWLAGLVGSVAAAIWNFTTTSIFTWGSGYPGKKFNG